MIAGLTVAIAGLVVGRGTVVMIHGAGGGGWEYDFWKPQFTHAGYKVVAPDLTPSGGGLAKTTYADYEAQVIGWAKTAKRPLIVVGASMGGALAQSTAKDLKPDAMVLVDSVAPKGVGERRASQDIPEIVRWANGPIQDTRDAMPDSDEKTIQWAWKKWRDESGAVMRTLTEGIKAAAPDCPVLTVWGENDTDIPVETGVAIAKVYHADMKVYSKTSHVGPLLGTRSQEIASDVLRWIEGAQKPDSKHS